MVSISSYWLLSTELSILNNKKIEVTFVKCSKLLFDKIMSFSKNESFPLMFCKSRSVWKDYDLYIF